MRHRKQRPSNSKQATHEEGTDYFDYEMGSGGRAATDLQRRTKLLRVNEEECSESIPRQAAGFDFVSGEDTLFTMCGIPFTANVIIFIVCFWAVIYGIGCCFRVHFAYHWNGYLHVTIPIFGFAATLTAILGYCLDNKFARKCALASMISWVFCVLAALGLIVRSGFVYANFLENRAIEGFRSFFLYAILWAFFTDLLCFVTVILDSVAAFAGFKIWRNKATS